MKPQTQPNMNDRRSLLRGLDEISKKNLDTRSLKGSLAKVNQIT